MAGVVNTYGDAEAAKRAIAAGADVLLMPTDVRRAVDAVLVGITEGRYDESRIDASARRVLVLKHEFGLARDRYVDLDGVRRLVGDSAHVAVADAIAERGFVLARDPSGLVPLTTGGAKPRVLSVTYAHRSDLPAGTVFDAGLRHGVATLRSAYVDADEPAPNYRRLLDDAASFDAVVVGSYVNVTSESATADAPRAFVEFVDSLLARNPRVVLVSFGSPYLLMQTPRVPAYAVAWGGSAASQGAAARALLGEIPVTARLPIAIPPLLSIGAGERRAALSPGGALRD